MSKAPAGRQGLSACQKMMDARRSRIVCVPTVLLYHSGTHKMRDLHWESKV